MTAKGARPERPDQLAAFENWWSVGCVFRKMTHKPARGLRTYYEWAERYDWQGRSEARRAKLAPKIEAKAVNDTAKFLMDQQQAGALMRMLGVKHLTALGKEQKPFENTGRAIAAIKTGIDIERQAIGLPSIVATILNTNNVDELNAVIRALTASEAAADGDSTLADTGDNES